jgi:sugar phosphate isomerase/epimerase
MNVYGLQMYSVRDLAKDDFFGSLKRVAEIGYQGLEFAGYFNVAAPKLREVLRELGLYTMGSHIAFERLSTHLEEEIDYLLNLEGDYIICPWLPVHMRDTEKAWQRTASILNHIGYKCRASGIKFGYHHHDFEFMKFNDEYGLDILMNYTDPEVVLLEPDVFWIEYCGLNSLDVIDRYAGRCLAIHLKDQKCHHTLVNTEVGKGMINFPEIIAQCQKHRISRFIVEQENFEIPVLQSITDSLRYVETTLKPFS